MVSHVGMIEKAGAHDLVVAKADEEIHKPIQETAISACAVTVDLHVTDWLTTQQEHPILKTMIKWTSGHKVQDLKHLLGRQCRYLKRVKLFSEKGKKLTPYQGALYHHHTPACANWRRFCSLWSPRLIKWQP